MSETGPLLAPGGQRRDGWTFDPPGRPPPLPGLWLVHPTPWERWRMKVRLAYLLDRSGPRSLERIAEIQQLTFLTGAWLALVKPDA